MSKNKKTSSNETRRKFSIMFFIVLICFGTIASLIYLGTTGYEEKVEAKAYVLENHTQQTSAENAVTAIYLNYRMLDTIFEAMLLLLSAMAVKSLSWSNDDE